MRRRLARSIACLAVTAAVAAIGCQKQVVSSDFRPSTGVPVGQSLPYHKPNIPIDIASSGNNGGTVMPDGMKSMSNWHDQHRPDAGPKFKPQTIGTPGNDR